MPTQLHALTGLPTRAELDQELKQAITRKESCALALLDMDGLVEVNAELGNEAGDRVLKALAALMQQPAVGEVYHIGGDEFALMVKGITLEQAFLTMEALRARIAGAKERFGLPNGRGVTVRLGVAQYPRDAGDAGGLWSAASAALHAAKENGGNQVSLPPNEEMVMKSCYYPASSMRKLKALAERLHRKDSPLLREALDDLFRKYELQTQ